MRQNIPQCGEHVKPEKYPDWGATDFLSLAICPTMGNGLKMLRKRAGMTHQAAGDAMGMSRGAFIKIERGERQLTEAHIRRAMSVFSASEADVLNGEDALTPVVGFVNAGSDALLFAEGQGPFDTVEAPEWATETTVAVEIRGDSLGGIFNGWLIFYDDRRDPPTEDMFGNLCVIGLTDGRVVVKLLRPGSRPGLFNLFANFAQPVYDVEVLWAARVREMRPK